ncbi:MAG TPA: FxsA family protein [Actinophytocola sp.]|uniref:FxsA family protein n=1 Tax=Actinophytocola sp. TaxID=1872138 RepID=UPI002DB83DFB|nr:FxsA family protein [Actinophytocola sp.]HEU5473476.1 FxsA family protein [Actinophytocola sp.]
MPILLLLLLATFVEITVLVLVGNAIGLLPTILLLILASVAGVWLLRREGARTITAYQRAMRERRVPHREMLDGLLIAVAGVLVMVPGFVSDVLALALLLPPVRAMVTRRLTAAAERRVRSARQGGAIVVDSTVVDSTVVDPTVLDGGEIERRG